MKTFVIGDIHGAHKALIQVLKLSQFDKKKDRLISLGDVSDAWPEVPECVEELLSIKNRIDIVGNHDEWTNHWLRYTVKNQIWLSQGGQATYDAYTIYNPDLMIKHEQQFFSKQIKYYIDDKNRIFVHGGFNRHELVENQRIEIFTWDRNLFTAAMANNARKEEDKKKFPFKTKNNFKEIFIGHTTTTAWETYLPINVPPVWNLDTGAGWSGKLTIMNVDTKEYWQSDKVNSLYPNIKGRY